MSVANSNVLVQNAPQVQTTSKVTDAQEARGRRAKQRLLQQQIKLNQYRPLAEVRKDKALSRWAKRAIHFIKYRALDCLPQGRLRASVYYSQAVSPFDVQVITLKPENTLKVSQYLPNVSKTSVPSTPSTDYISWERARGYTPFFGRQFVLHEEWEGKLPMDFFNSVMGKEACWMYAYHTLKNPPGAHLTVNGIPIKPDMPLSEYGVVTVMPALNGGVRKKRSRNRKPVRKTRKNQGGLNRGVQLGQINRYVPSDKPIVTTLRYNNVLSTDGSGIVSARFSLRNPQAAFNGSGSYVNAVDYAALYDMYKVKSFCLQYEPLPNGPSKGALVVAYDYDATNSAGTPNYANIVNYGAYRIFNAGMQFETMSRIPVITAATDTSTDPPTSLTVHQGGWIDAATSAAPGQMYIGGLNLGNSVTIGSFVLTLKVAWKFRR